MPPRRRSSPSPASNRPPSRQSSRAITPARSDPNFIRPSQDGQKSVAPTPTSVAKRTKNKTGSHSKRKRKDVESDLDISSDHPQTAIDIRQDSEDENSKVKGGRKKRKKRDDDLDLNDIEAYFHNPKLADGQESGPPVLYKCRWCGNSYKQIPGTHANLYKHRDGDKTRRPCPSQADAIKNRAKLPLTPKEIETKLNEKDKDPIKMMLDSGSCDTTVFNHLMLFWLVHHSLPWNRFEDFALGVALNYHRKGSGLFSRAWVAKEAHKLYVNLQNKAIDRLKNLDSKITLIHDVWTTKGNRQAFMGISAAYVLERWNFHSGSNNRTLAAEVDWIILKETATYLNLSDSHIRCFCHKVALIVNAGLRALSLSSTGLNKTKKATLGYVPELDAIEEDNKTINPPSDGLEIQVGPFNKRAPIIEESDSDVKFDDKQADASDQSNIVMVFNKVDFVIQKITSLAARQSEFNHCRERAYQACHVINKLIENEKDQQEQDNNKRGPNFFDNVEIGRNDWELVRKLNDTLAEFYFITKKMEGNTSSGSMMLGEYWGITSFLKKKLRAASKEEFHPMFVKMIDQTEKYVNKALKCDTIILATILNPTYWLSIFQTWYPAHQSIAKSLITREFDLRRIEYEANLTVSQPPALQEQSESEKQGRRKRDLEDVDLFPEIIETTPTDELSIYLSGKFKQSTSQAHKALQLWKPGFSNLGTPCTGLFSHVLNLGQRGEVFLGCGGHMRP
ncbi:hypothetical protein PTTG_27178 [Puccinia triticina 1-1 BBBD Race 1]|uniref:BED-type domain-containing protein n=1 Tax=Puccinia triticina (isolate 1-1 / race 1 (BBBD)) TaxID=630390 RepID=A0A180GM10_PUCT1|nr:hypothetical protein PTTG_27178 [Puccinia triticina 1-1 BBBD Race 1]